MRLARSHHVSLFFVWFLAISAHVEPPTNVTLRCHNLDNLLEWSYGQFVPELKFRVDILSLNRPPDSIWVNPPDLQADVSFLSNPSDAYVITVTAVVGQNESEPAPADEISFSYFMNSPAKQKCFLDFPSVNITADQEGHVQFRFTHPWLLYHTRIPSNLQMKSRKKKSHEAKPDTRIPEFMYDVVVMNQHTPERFTCETSVCEERLTVDPAQDKYCLIVKGEMLKMLVRGKQEYCTMKVQPDENKYTYIAAIVVSLLALIAITLILCMVYKKKTMPSVSTLPPSMTFRSRLKQWTLRVVQEQVSVPEVDSNLPKRLLPEEDAGKGLTTSVTSSTDYDLRFPIGVSAEDEGVCDIVQVVNEENPEYLQGHELEADEIQPSGSFSDYEKRPVLVELAPNEPAEGYRG